MGIAASSNGTASGASSTQGQTTSTSSGDVIRRCNCYSMSYLSLDRRCYRHSLTFNHAGDKTAINPKQKKKRSYGFATFKKKLIGKRRHCKGSDHGRCFREHFIDCPSDNLKSLLGQYEALTLQKDLSVQADLARPPAQTLGQNLAEIFEAQSCCDIILVYHGHRIPAHKSILMARCPYFSRHLAFHRSNEFHLRTRGCVVPLEVLKSVLKYLYTDNAELLGNTTRGDAEAMTMLEDEFGIPNSLESDVSFLLETLSLGDLKLVFDGAAADFLCHKTILAARSPFFGRLIGKKAALAAAASAAALLAAGGSSSEIMEIRLDSQIIPAKYAKILLNALYLDSLDFRLVEPGDNVTVAESSAAEDHVTEAMELYEIGRFLEFNFLSQSCEDLLMQVMSMSNVTAILDWSLEPHGSSWIGRQAYQFLEEEFFNVSNNQDHVLGSLNAGTMVRILKSDFTQASESEVLQALVKWGEHQLSLKPDATKEASEAAAAANTATLGRKAPKRREVCDSELKELLAPLLPYVRIPHVLPRDKTSEVLDMALQRNLFSVLPNFTSQVNAATKYSPWDPKSTNGLFVRPRLFLPYFDECKKLIQDRCAQDPEIISSNSPCVSVPDTLYMLRSAGRNKVDSMNAEGLLQFQSSKLPDNEIIGRMMERMKKLVNSVSVQRALSSNCIDANEVMHLVELRVVREFNLPDNYATILHKARRRSMSGDFEDQRVNLSSSRIFYTQYPHDGRNFEDTTAASSAGGGHHRTGPDVTLATNAVSSLSLQPMLPMIPIEQQQQKHESPDLVSLGGATALFDSVGCSARYLWKQTPSSALSVAASPTTPTTTIAAPNSQQRMSHSYCTGPSHMYL